MFWLALGVCLGAVSAVAVGALYLQRRSRSPLPRQHGLSLEVRARSADETLVRLSVRVDVTLLPPATNSTLRSVVDELEAALRQCVATRRVLALPGVGDELTLPVDSTRATLGSVVVTGADVEVTRELRRLVGGP